MLGGGNEEITPMFAGNSCRSTSVGDVVEVDKKKYKCNPVGVEGSMKNQNIVIVGLIMSTIVLLLGVRADPLKNPMPWLVPQIYSATMGPMVGVIHLLTLLLPEVI